MKKIFSLFFLILLLLSTFLSVSSLDNKVRAEALPKDFKEEAVTIYFFDDRLCPVCRDAKNFIEKTSLEYKNLDLIIHPITDTKKLKEVATSHGVLDYRVMSPTIFIGENFFQFRDFTSRQEQMIIDAIDGKKVDNKCCVTKIPFLNIELDISNWSLPIVTAVLGSIDGFNVCSIGALILILSIVLAFNSKKKIFFFGGLFIITTVLVYGVLVFVWGRLFDALIGHLEILRLLVGLASLGGAVYFFKEFWRFFKFGPTCKASNSSIVTKTTKKLRQSFENPKRGLLILSLAVVSFATVITLVELPCSVGVPIAFSGILIEAGVSMSSYISYILLYLFFYMLMELIVFTGAVLTKKIWFAGSKAITWITFAGSMVLFYLAFYYIF